MSGGTGGTSGGGGARHVLVACLVALSGLFLFWFGREPWGALVVFAVPPAVLALAALRGWRRAGFWSGVLALAWFSHGVMVAWTRAPERLFAVAEIILALVVVFAASLPGLRARFGGRRC